MAFRVKVKDLATQQETAICTPAFVKSADDAKTWVEEMPRSRGGTHPGFEIIGVEEFDANKLEAEKFQKPSPAPATAA